MRAPLSCLLAVALVACGEPEAPGPPPEVHSEPEATGAPVAPDTPELPAEEPEPSPPSRLALPGEIAPIDTLPVTRRSEGDDGYGDPAATWPVVAHPDAAVRETLAVIAHQLTRPGRSGEHGVRCGAPLTHEHLVSFFCAGDTDEDSARGEPYFRGWSALYAIADGHVRPVSLDDAFLEGGRAAARAMADARCIEESRALDPDDPFGWYCRDEDAIEWLGVDGFSVSYVGERMSHHTTHVRWDELRPHLRAHGPLAPVLTDAEPAPPPRVADEDARGWAVTDMALARDLVLRWARLDRDDGAALRLERFTGGVARLVLPGADGARAREVAAALGAEPVALAAAPEGEPIRWVRSRRDLNLAVDRADWGRRVLMTLPSGSVFPAIGTIGRPRHHVDGHLPFVSGDVAGRWLAEDEGCEVEPPGDDAGSALVARVDVRRRGAASPGALFVSTAEGRSLVALHALEDERCTVGDALVEITAEGVPRDVRLSGTTEHGGTTIVVVGTFADGELRYAAHRVGTSEALWTHAFPRPTDPEERAPEHETLVRTGETVGGAYHPLSYLDGEELRRLTWADGTLRETDPE